jgi:hypothetical protein
VRRVLAVTAAMVMGVGVAVLIDERRADDRACSSSVYDGAVLPGGPQSPDEALVGFLSVNTGDELPSELGDYQRIEVADGAVMYVAGDVAIHAEHRDNGWWIGSVEVLC